MRIRVVLGSTRAAARSLGNDRAPLGGVLVRGRGLLDQMEPDIQRDGSAAVREAFTRAREELDGLDST